MVNAPSRLGEVALDDLLVDGGVGDGYVLGNEAGLVELPPPVQVGKADLEPKVAIQALVSNPNSIDPADVDSL